MAFTRPKAAQIDFDITNITDPLIRLNSGQSGANDKDVGIVIERGSDTNVAIIYDESADQFVLVNTTEDGSTSGNVTISSYANLQAGTITATGNLIIDTNTLFVNAANNRVGIGTTSPAYQVEIENTGANALLVLDRTDGAACFIEGQATRSAFGSVGATPLALAYNSAAVVTIGASGAITVNPDGANPYTFPTTDGSANQVLATNGSGTLSFVDQSGGGGSGHTIQNAGSSLTDRANLNFDGTYLVATDDAGNNQTDVTIGSGVVTTTGTQTLTNKTLDVPTFTGNATFDTNTLFVDAANNRVGIGTTSPASKTHIVGSSNDTVSQANANLNIEGAGGNGIVVGTISSSPYTSYLQSGFVDNFGTATYPISLNPSGGNVGIGNTNPDYKLDIQGDNLGGTSGDTVDMLQLYSNVGNSSYLNFQKVRTSTGSNWNSAGTRIQQVIDVTKQGYIQFNGDGNDYGISFGRDNLERMRIDSSGNVGIGQTNPSRLLEVLKSGVDDVNIALIGGGSGAGGASVAIGASGTSSYIRGVNNGVSGYVPLNVGGSVTVLEISGSEKMRIDSNGRVGIGTTSPNRALGIVAATNVGGFESTVTDNVADQNLYANLIDYDISGSDTTTADRTHIGLRLDIDSSASGGDTNNEHRIYGIWNDIDVTEDSDIVWGTYNSVRTTHSTGTISDMRGAYNVVEADGTGTVTSAYGSYNYTLSGTTVGGLTNAYGSFNKYGKEAADTSTVTSGYGVYAEVEIDGGTITNAYGVRSIIDRDGGTVTNGYLYRGEYQGTYASGTHWGVYLSGEEKSYFSGNVGIGTTSPSTALEVNGTVTATLFDGVATSARYADLAERYEADAEYPAGTVMIFGGEKEVTQSTSKMDRRKAGVVSEKPAYMMNCDLVETVEYAPYIALQGRVPVRVIGEVCKGDLMITSSLPGCAEAWREEGDPRYGSVIGKALANKTTTEEELIEVVVGVI